MYIYYKKLTPFKWFVLQNFPFIDEDFDAITNYQMFCKLGEEINKVIESQNLVGEQVENLTNSYNALANYVNNYFASLDVQEEINNKLDEMADSGELGEIINIEIFNELNEKIDDIKKSTLINVVEELPLELNDNTEYEVISYEENIDIEIPISNYQILQEAKEKSIENANNDIIRVGTFNTFNQNTPYRINVKGLYKYAKLRRIFNKLACNILSIQEMINTSQFPVQEFLTTDFLEFINFAPEQINILPLVNSGNGTLSNIEQQSFIYKKYDDRQNETFCYTKTIVSYNNKIISIYNTHNEQIVAQDQLNELYDAVMSDTSPYKIICGDFNVPINSWGASYFNKFFNSGFKNVNVNGQYKDAGTTAFSDILVSSNIDIVNSLMYTDIDGQSDHFPIIADLKLRG